MCGLPLSTAGPNIAPSKAQLRVLKGSPGAGFETLELVVRYPFLVSRMSFDPDLNRAPERAAAEVVEAAGPGRSRSSGSPSRPHMFAWQAVAGEAAV